MGYSNRIYFITMLVFTIIAIPSYTQSVEDHDLHKNNGSNIQDENIEESTLTKVNSLISVSRKATKEKNYELVRESSRRALNLLMADRESIDEDKIHKMLKKIGYFSNNVNDKKTAFEAWKWSRDILLRIRPEDDADRIVAEHNMATYLIRERRLLEAQVLVDRIIVVMRRTGLHPNLMAEALYSRADILGYRGDWRNLIVTCEEILEAHEKGSKYYNRAINEMRWRLGVAYNELKKWDQAECQLRIVMENAERDLSKGDNFVQRCRTNLGVALYHLERYKDAHDLFISIIHDTRNNPNYPEYERMNVHEWLIRISLAIGETEESKTLLNEYLEDLEGRYPEGHRYIFKVKSLLVLKHGMRLDLPGAFKQINEIDLETSSATELSFVSRFIIASLHFVNLDFKRSRVEFSKLLMNGSKHMLEHDLRLQQTRIALAAVLVATGQPENAVELIDELLDIDSKYHTLEPVQIQSAQMCRVFAQTAINRASSSLTIDHLGEVRSSLEKGIALLNSDPYRKPHICNLRTSLAIIDYLLDDHDATIYELMCCAHDEIQWISDYALLSPRELRELIGMRDSTLSVLLSISSMIRYDEKLDEKLFELIETLRAISCGGHFDTIEVKQDPIIKSLRQNALMLKAEVSKMTRNNAADSKNRKESTIVKSNERPIENQEESLFVDKIREKDMVEQELRIMLGKAGVLSKPVKANDLAQGLPRESVAVSYRVYSRLIEEEGEGRAIQCIPSVLAYVLSPKGKLTRIEIGNLAEIDRAVMAWRNALGIPFEMKKSKAIPSLQHKPKDRLYTSGVQLRQILFDPILKVASGSMSFHVCSDGPLHMVAIDALPLEGGYVGDVFKIYNELSFARFMLPGYEKSDEPNILAIGGVNFNAEVVGSISSDLGIKPGNYRSLTPGSHFLDLPNTKQEVILIAELFKKRFGRMARTLEGDQATWEAFIHNSNDATFLHIATHGFFYGDSLEGDLLQSRSEQLLQFGATLGEGMIPMSGMPWKALGIELESSDVVSRFAPMALCGLALAGANNHSMLEVTQRMPGIISGEEISSLDLSGCELAILSACDTNVGLYKSGQGLLSLQTAFHAAGAQSVVTSLWPVKDVWAQKLMESFYKGIWERGETKSQALWKAKRTLRDLDAEVRDWAGWILTGKPN